MAPTVVASTRQLFGGSKPQLAAHGRTAQRPLCCYCPMPPWPSACCTRAGARGSTRLRHTGHSGLLRSQGSRQAAWKVCLHPGSSLHAGHGVQSHEPL